MPNVSVYACSGVACLKNGAPIENAVFKWITYDGKTAQYHDIAAAQSGNVYTFSLPVESADVNISAPGHGSGTERMENFNDYSVRI